MNNGIFGENFPYSNFHDMNLDWIIKIAKDFLDQYSHIQETIGEGEEELQAKYDALASALDELVENYNEEIAQRVVEATQEFANYANAKGAEVLASIPSDYSTLSNKVDVLELNSAEKMLDLTFTEGYINPETLEIVTQSGNHLYSNVILIPAKTLLYVPKISKSASTTLVAKCNSSGVPTAVLMRGTSTDQSTGEYMIIPIIYATYVRLAGNSTMATYMKYYTKAFTEDMIFDASNISTWHRLTANDLYGEGIITNGGVDNTATWFNYTASLPLNRGMTVEFWAGGGDNACVLSEYSAVGYTIVQGLVYGNSGIIHMKYTAPRDMYIRICARVQPVTVGFSYVLPVDLFHNWKIYYDKNHNTKYDTSPLWGKHLTVMGDSLIYGGGMGNGPTWITNLGMKYQMDYENLGIGSNTVAIQTQETTNPAMVERISDVPTDTDIFVLLGGANDKRLVVPIGNIDSSDTTTFCGALNSIIDQMRARCPKAKLLFMTTYHRYDSRNLLGFGDEDYANAMIQVCKNRGIPVFDNYHCTGIDFTNTYMAEWLDETVNRLMIVDGQVVQHEPTQHLSIEAYDWLTPIYDAYLTEASATGYLKYDNTYSKEFIDSILETETTTNITSQSIYVEPHGKYAQIGNTVYFKILFKSLRAISGGTGGSVPVANLPIPVGTPVFYEEGCKPFDTGSRLMYDTLWRLSGTRTLGSYTLVYGSYTTA